MGAICATGLGMTRLDELKKHSVVVADTGDIESIQRFRPQDATTNPSLLLKAAQMPQYQRLVEDSLQVSLTAQNTLEARKVDFMDQLFVAFGREILKLIPGRVSTEVDAGLSFDTEATLAKARKLIGLYEQAGIPKNRILIKIASTWEGIRAAEILEKDGIHCNLTLLFSFAQAVACAEAGVTLISPFVGRIYDWHKKHQGVADIAIASDPGVASVRRIFNYYKNHGYKTEVMGASFRKVEQVTHLAGCDLLTISPELLDELAGSEGQVPAQLSSDLAKSSVEKKIHLDEAKYRWEHNQDEMAVEKLSDGIRRFYDDARKLEAFVEARLSR
jgi:transaldolase